MFVLKTDVEVFYKGDTFNCKTGKILGVILSKIRAKIGRINARIHINNNCEGLTMSQKSFIDH